MLEEAVSYAVRGDWRRRTVRGGALVFVGLLIVAAAALVEPTLAVAALAPAIPLAGYALRVLGDPIGPGEPPAVDGLADLLRAGLAGAAVWTGYAVLPAALVAALLGATMGTGDATGFWTLAGATGSILAVGAYLAPAAVAAAVRTGSIDGATDWRSVASVASGRAYFAATLQSIVVWFVAAGVTVMLLVTVFGLVLVPGLLFLALVVVARLYALAVVATIDPAEAAVAGEESMPGL